MALIIVFTLSIVLGLMLAKLLKGRRLVQFRLTPYVIGGIISSIVYYIAFEEFAILIISTSNAEHWGGAMAALILHDAVITSFLYGSLCFAILDQIFLRIQKLPIKFKVIVTTALSVCAFAVVFFNEVSDAGIFYLRFSPTSWWR